MTTIRVGLCISSKSLLPEALARIMALEATRSWRTGESVSGVPAGPFHSQNAWVLWDQELQVRTPASRASALLDNLLSRTSGAHAELRALVGSGVLEVSILIEVKFVQPDRPDLSIDPKVLARIAYIGGSLSIDVY